MPIPHDRGALTSLRAWTTLGVLLACAPVQVLAQDDNPSSGQIRGQVVEARTAAPLAAVLVQVESTRQRAISDADGHFMMDGVPLGAQTLVVSVVGFGLVRREVTVTSGGIEVTIPIAGGASTYVEDVAVTAGRFREAQPGAASQSLLGSRELLALRGVIADDPFRAVQVLPNVAASDDYRAEFAVRGLGPYHVGLSIDEIDSRLLFHTVGGVQETGSLALINSDILEEATLLSGVHPQKLGAHLGARLDFRTRDGARDRLRARALVSGSATTVVAEGPLGSGTRGSWLVAGRKSYIDWILRRVDTSIGGTFGFADAQGKLTLTPTPSQTLRVSILGGNSELDEDNDDDPTDFDRGNSRTAIGNLQWRLARSPRLALTQQLYLVDARYRNVIGDGRPREEGADRDLTWRAGLEWSPSHAHFVDIGAQVQSLAADRIDRRFFASSQVTLVDAHIDASTQAAWLSYRWTANAHLMIVPGVRVERWDRLDETAASPWVLTEWQVSDSTRVRGGFGVQRQAPGLDEMLFGVPDLPMRPERARLVDIGVERKIGDVWRASATAYYRRESDRLRVVDAESRLVEGRVVRPAGPAYVANAMDGTARGLELIVERRSSGGLTGWVSYAYGNAENTDRGIRSSRRMVPEETFPADWDQRHTLNTNVEYRWSERSSLSVRYRYGSNFPLQGYYVGIDADRHTLTAERNAGRLPRYSRLDIRADRTFTYRTRRLTLFAEVINVLNQSNYRTTSASLNTRTGEVSGLLEKLFPLLPSAGILIEF
jgi:CarboxypepD_reg-like domain